MERDYAYTIGRDLGDLKSPEWVGEECARRTLSRLSPRKLATMKAPVIFAAEVATGLFGHLVGAISGGAVYRKSTFLLDALGEDFAPDPGLAEHRDRLVSMCEGAYIASVDFELEARPRVAAVEAGLGERLSGIE